jgi:predicted RNA-binding Zn ribbon-like protein
MTGTPKDVQPVFMALGDHLALDFLNTVLMDGGKLRDLLESDEDVRNWLATFEMEPVEAVAFARGRSGELLQHARRLRECARKMVLARKTGVSSNTRVLNEFLRQGENFYELRWPSDPVGMHTPKRIAKRIADSPAALMRPVAEAVAELLEAGDFDLIKKCENPKCSMLFCDLTKSHRRRWCSPTLCGNRMKVAAFRERMRQKA